MATLFHLHQCYTTELPPFAVLQQLQQVVWPPLTGWRRLFSWMRPPCRGTINAAAGTFQARVPHGRSDGPVVQGQWQPAPTVGSLVRLTVSLSADNWLGLVVASLVLLVWGVVVFHAVGWLASLLLLFPLLLIADLQWSLRRAAHYFQESLQLIPLLA